MGRRVWLGGCTKYHSTAITTAQTPKKINTLRQPPSSGERTVALKREPSINPVAKPADMTPDAKPNWREANHSRFNLTKFMGNMGCTMPNKNEVINSDQKSTAKPRSAPLTPVARHSSTNVRRVPK